MDNYVRRRIVFLMAPFGRYLEVRKIRNNRNKRWSLRRGRESLKGIERGVDGRRPKNIADLLESSLFVNIDHRPSLCRALQRFSVKKRKKTTHTSERKREREKNYENEGTSQETKRIKRAIKKDKKNKRTNKVIIN